METISGSKGEDAGSSCELGKTFRLTDVTEYLNGPRDVRHGDTFQGLSTGSGGYRTGVTGQTKSFGQNDLETGNGV